MAADGSYHPRDANVSIVVSDTSDFLLHYDNFSDDWLAFQPSTATIIMFSYVEALTAGADVVTLTPTRLYGATSGCRTTEPELIVQKPSNLHMSIALSSIRFLNEEPAHHFTTNWSRSSPPMVPS